MKLDDETIEACARVCEGVAADYGDGRKMPSKETAHWAKTIALACSERIRALASQEDRYETFGYALAMRVLQSDLYRQLDDRERAECDELIQRGMDAAKERA